MTGAILTEVQPAQQLGYPLHMADVEINLLLMAVNQLFQVVFFQAFLGDTAVIHLSAPVLRPL